MKFSAMLWLGMAVLFLSTVSGQDFSAQIVPEPVIDPFLVEDPASLPDVAVLPVDEPEPVILPLPAEEPGAAEIAPLPVFDPQPLPDAGSESGDATSRRRSDSKSPKTRSETIDDDRSPRTRLGKKAKSPRRGAGSGSDDDDRSPRTRLGSGKKAKSPREQSGSGSDDDDRSPRTRLGSGKKAKSPRGQSGSGSDDDDSSPGARPRSNKRSPNVKLSRPVGRDNSKRNSPKTRFPVDRDDSDDNDSPRRNFRNGRSSSDDDDYSGGKRNPRRSSGGRQKVKPARPTRRGPANDNKNGGDLKSVVGRSCADKFSGVGCSYYKAKGMCASKAFSHVRMAWTKCRKTCGLCKVAVPDCLPGYRFDNLRQVCTDIDECAEGTAVCAANANCVNKEGSYLCRCNSGFVGNGKVLCQAQCADASDTCAKYVSDCFLSSRRVFMTTVCPVTCNQCSVKCAKGYRVGPDGKTCVNVNECAEKTGVCPVHSTCVDTKGSYQCTCNAGYIFNTITQSCVQYCLDLSAQCDALKADCVFGTSLQQAWMATYCASTCGFCDQPRCARGYKLSAQGQCVDLDECSSPELNECAANSKCANTDGSYTCTCLPGFKGSGFVECTTAQCYDLLPQSQCSAMVRSGGCQSNSNRNFRFCARSCKVCTNDVATTCSKGYVAKNGVCLDLNECKALTHKCPANSKCVNKFGGYRCTCNQGFSASKYTGEWQCVRENTCYVAGDPHYKTFDGGLIQYQGVCSYTLAQPNPKKRGILSDFSVVIKNEHRDGEMKLSWAKSVKLTIYGTVVLLDRDGVVYVNGERKSVPYSPNAGISITPSGNEIKVTTMAGVTLSYDGKHLVKVSVPDSYKGKMAGICGNLDGRPSNDYVTKEGVPTTSHAKIGNSWTVPDPDEVCQPATDENVDDCTPQVKAQASGKSQCGILKDTKGPFADCIKKVDPSFQYEACMIDLCLATKHPESLCRNLQAFADLCQASGVTVSWRSDSLCPMTCPANSVYSPAASACPATCFNPSSEGTCNSLPVEGCVCSAGMVRDGNQKCVPVAQCGCQLNGVYHATGDIWYDDACAYKYTCLEQSTILMVPITCQTSGTCQSKDNKVACYCSDPAAGTNCDVESGIPQTVPNDPKYNPTAPILAPRAVQYAPTTTPAPTPSTTPPYVPPHPDGEIADDEYFNEPPPPPRPPKARPLGVESGALPDSALQPSSSTPTDPPRNARPNSRRGWKPDPTDKEPHLTVDLGKPMDVHGVGSLGHYNESCWVTNYNVHTSLDGQAFTPLLDTRPEFSTQPRNFLGNTDQNTWKKHCLHQYYGAPVRTRFVKFVPLANNGCTAMRVELYGFRDGKDPAQVQVLGVDQWTRNTTGCNCYFDGTSTECACCFPGGCQCPRSNLHQCVQCGSGDKCGIPEVKLPDEQLDPWTISPTGCACQFDPSRTDCACCAMYACQCGQFNRNQCVTCGHPEHCGQKEDIFGPNEVCVPKSCTSN